MNYSDFEDRKLLCRDCFVGKVYDCVVPSYGCKSNPKVVVMGEAPGADEVENLQPFVGKAGKLLRATLNEFGFRQSNTLITNVIPCRPEKNKFPKDLEIVRKCTKKWLYKELEIVRPSFIILIGAKPLKFVLNRDGITKCRGEWYDFVLGDHTIKCMPTFHTSYVLRKKYMEDGDDIMAKFRRDVEEVAKVVL